MTAIDKYRRYEELLSKAGKKSADVAAATGIPQSTFTDWKKGRSAPKAEKLAKIAAYLGVSMEYLTTGQPLPLDNTTLKPYYYNDQTAQIAQEFFDNPDLGWLHHNVPKMPPEDIAVLKKMAEALYKKEFPDDN